MQTHSGWERPDTCRADFEQLPSPTADPRRAYFRALPWHNNNKKPQRICWRFGDGQDTCINYPNSYTDSMLLHHNYQHPGLYEVCVNILYVGGCEAHKCKPIQVGERPDTCRADFEGSRVQLLIQDVHISVHCHGITIIKTTKICWEFGDCQDTVLITRILIPVSMLLHTITAQRLV
jgi:hypothetical protein